MRTFFRAAVSVCPIAGIGLLLLLARALAAQVTPADYERALGLQDKYRNLALHLPSSPEWIEGTHRFVYSRTVAAPAYQGQGRERENEPAHEYILFDADTRESRLAFDHDKLADALSKALNLPVKPQYLPLARLRFTADEKSLEFLFHDVRWRCDLAGYVCAKKADLSPDDDDFEGDEYDFTPKAINGDALAKTSPDGKWQANTRTSRQIPLFQKLLADLATEAGMGEFTFWGDFARTPFERTRSHDLIFAAREHQDVVTKK